MVYLITNSEKYYADLCDEIRLFYNERNIPMTDSVPMEGTVLKHALRYEEGRIINTSELYENGEVRCVRTVVLPDGEFTELERTRAEKHGAKNSIYMVLADHTGIRRPWGSLTGVRPSKMYRDLVRNLGAAEADRRMREEYFLSEGKLSLLKQIYEVQEPFIDSNEPGRDIDIYVGIPFCTSRCSYCSFFSLLASKDGGKEHSYVDALIREIDASADMLENRNIRSLYMGGGTPTALSDNELERVLCHLDRYVSGREFTVEAGRPDTITESKLALLKDHNVARISINPQSTCERTLGLIGRSHSISQFYSAVEMALGMGFDSINMDLIAGLQDEDTEIFMNSLKECMAFGPQNITVHTLAIKKGSRYGMEDFKGYTDEAIVSEMISGARELLSEKGYIPYYLYKQKYMAGNLENVGYCMKGKECIYNIDMMEDEADVVAFGLGTSSRRIFNDEGKIKRFYTPKDLSLYISDMDGIIEKRKELFA